MSKRLGPEDFELGSIESRAAARGLIEQRRQQGIRISIVEIGQTRPKDKPKPERRWPNGGGFEKFYIDDEEMVAPTASTW